MNYKLSQDTYTKLKTQWEKVKPCIDITDIAYVLLRIIILFGGIGWLIFSRISEKTFGDVSKLFMALRVRVWVILYLLEHGCEDFQTEILFIS